MSERGDPARWTTGGARTEEERQAAALFSAAAAPVPPLGPESLARIEAGVTEKMGHAASWAAALKAGGGLALVLVGAAGWWALKPAPGLEAPGVEVKEGPEAPGLPAAPEVATAMGARAELAATARSAAPGPRLGLHVAPAAGSMEPAVPRSPERSTAPKTRAKDPLAEEARLIALALQSARESPTRAIAVLDAHARRFPDGQLMAEARRARLDALIALGDHRGAAKLAGGLAVEAAGSRAVELTVVEAEQLAAGGDCRRALGRFERAMGAGAKAGMLRRALEGRAGCRRALGDVVGAEQDRVKAAAVRE